MVPQDRGMVPVTTHALAEHDFASPIDDRWFEDYRPGETYEYGWRSVTSEERSKPDRGIVRTDVALLTEDDRCPLSARAINLLLCRPAV